jgi:hypothetical protein
VHRAELPPRRDHKGLDARVGPQPGIRSIGKCLACHG